MGNCLLIKLKESVDNDSLERLGDLKFEYVTNIPANVDSIKLAVSQTNTSKFSTTNSQEYVDHTLSIGTNQYDSELLLFEESKLYKCLVTDRYHLTVFIANTGLKDFDLSSLLYCRDLSWITLLNNDASVTGDVKEFLTKYASIDNAAEGRKMNFQINGSGVTSIPTGIAGVWNQYSSVHFNSAYKSGWYIEAADGTYYDSDGNVITP